LQWQNLLALAGGTVYGIIIGVLPGLGPSAGMALALPLVMTWHPATALIFMGSLYKCSNYGGSLSAILVNTPGDASNAATVLDGYPMCQHGKGGVALGLSATSAMVGGTIGMICLVFAAPFLAEFALRFGPAEYFMTAVLALSLIAAVVQGATIKGLMAAGLGLLLSTVGFDVITGHLRYTFGWAPLETSAIPRPWRAPRSSVVSSACCRRWVRAPRAFSPGPTRNGTRSTRSPSAGALPRACSPRRPPPTPACRATSCARSRSAFPAASAPPFFSAS
jgi:hypothetical protein